MTAGQNHLKNNNFPVPKGRIGKYSYLPFMVDLANLSKKNFTTLDNLCYQSGRQGRGSCMVIGIVYIVTDCSDLYPLTGDLSSSAYVCGCVANGL